MLPAVKNDDTRKCCSRCCRNEVCAVVIRLILLWWSARRSNKTDTAVIQPMTRHGCCRFQWLLGLSHCKCRGVFSFFSPPPRRLGGKSARRHVDNVCWPKSALFFCLLFIDLSVCVLGWWWRSEEVCVWMPLGELLCKCIYFLFLYLWKW